MKTATSISNYAAFVWLWRNDPEAKWFWFRCFITGNKLQQCVVDNLRDFGLTKKI